MPLIFGLDTGTTSIGFAVIDHDPDLSTGNARRLGVRIFPEARDPKGTPLNQERRATRLRRRQLRRRRDRRRLLGNLLCEAGLLPSQNSPDEWSEVMKCDPYELRKRAFEGDALSPHEVGRAIYHLAKRRHFKGRDIDEIADDSESENQKQDATEKRKEKEAKSERETTVKTLKQADTTLGAWLAERGPHERKRNVHATREIVEKEFDEVWVPLVPAEFREAIRDAIFSQRPVFWRKNTLGTCSFVPAAPLCPRGSWLSQQKRMLEKLNNLQIADGNQRLLDSEERAAILGRLQTQASMKWSSVRTALKLLYKSRGKEGAEKRLKFNLEEGGDKTLLGNSLEAKLNKIFGAGWPNHPHKQEIRDAVHDRIWRADYGEIGQRVVIRPAAERKKNRGIAAQSFIRDFGISEDQAAQLAELKLPTGWEPYSVEALQTFLPRLEAGERFGTLLNSPDWEDWRNATFPNREQPTGEILDRLPSPADKKEADRQRNLRNPTVVRVHNELRKVVNNLMSRYGRPDLIRVELAREVGLPKSKRDEIALGNRRREARRKVARKDLEEKGITPSHSNIEKWLLWEECGHKCPYTGKPICFEALFKMGEFQVEHIWPRSQSLDDSFRNKTLCYRDVNIKKGNRTPFEYLSHDAEAWAALENRLKGMKAPKGGVGMSPGKIKRFLAQSIPDDFANRQLIDTAYAAWEAVAFLKQLGPDIQVQAVSGRVTGHLRRLWGLNNILPGTGEKTRTDHRHHAVDALVVACCDPGVTQKLSRYWQDKDNPNPRIREPRLLPPWETIRDAAKQAEGIVVSHRVRKKVSGPLHEGLFYGDTREEETDKREITYRRYVKRKNVEELSKSELADIRDESVREIVKEWVDKHGGDPGKAFSSYPRRGRRGHKIRKVRLLEKRQARLMASVVTGYAKLGSNHHMAIYRLPNGDVDFEVVSLLEASQRKARREPVVWRERDDEARFLMSLSAGDALQFAKDGAKGVWIVESVWTSGVVVLVRDNDAIGATRFRPNAKSIVSKDAVKLSVDPIGRVRPAND